MRGGHDFHRPPETVRPDVPAVLRLGRVVRDDGDVAGRDAAFFRRADRAGGRLDGARRDDLAVLPGHGRRSIPGDGANPLVAARARRRRALFRVHANDVRRLLWRDPRLYSVLHADARVEQLIVVPADGRPRP